MPTSNLRYRGFFRFAACCVALLICLKFAPLNAQPLPDRRDFVGRVVDDDGKPLVGATITIRPTSDLGIGAFWGALTVSDANGEFRVPDVEDGKYFVSVEQGGFAPLQTSSYLLNRTNPRLDAALVRLVNFQIKVLKADGSPLPSTPLSVRVQGQDLKLPSWTRRAATTGDGILSLPNMVPGQYSVQIVAAKAGYTNVSELEINRKTAEITPEARLQASGQLQITARRKAETGDATTALGGAVLAISALPDDAAARAAGQLRPPEEVGLFLAFSDRFGVVTDESGALRLDDVPPGRYSLRLLMPGFATPDAQEIEIKSGVEGKAEFLFPSEGPKGSAQITLQDKDGKPLVETEWQLLMSQVSGTTVAVPELPGGGGLPQVLRMGGGSMRRGTTDAAGRSTLGALAPGKWNFILTPRPDKKGKRIAPVTQRVEVSDKGGEATFKFKGVKR